MKKENQPLLEKEVQKSLIEYLNYRGHYVWRNNSFAMNTTDTRGRNHFFWAGLKGSSDILGISKDGRFIAIEVKRKGNKPSPFQKAFLEEIRSRNGIAVVAYSLDDITSIL